MIIRILLIKAFALVLITQTTVAEMANNSPEQSDADQPHCPAFLDHSYRILHSNEDIHLCSLYKSKPVLIVNTASHCGYTHQFGGLEALYQAYKDKGLVIIGFASNDFMQEAKDEAKAADICFRNFGVTFTMLAPSKVRGKNANPTFQYLAEKTKKPSWNFNKYLVSADGDKVEHFGARAKPLGAKLEGAIQAAL